MIATTKAATMDSRISTLIRDGKTIYYVTKRDGTPAEGELEKLEFALKFQDGVNAAIARENQFVRENRAKRSTWEFEDDNFIREHELNSHGTDCSINCPACCRTVEVERRQLRAAINRIKEVLPRMSQTEHADAGHELHSLEQRYEFISAPGWRSRLWPDREADVGDDCWHLTKPRIIPWL